MTLRPRYVDLFAALLDPDPARSDAAFDSILFERARALPDLYHLYHDNPREPLLRFYAVQLMGFSESPDAVPVVLEALTDHDPSVRAEACRALEDIGTSDVVDVLEGRCEDLDPEVRRAAAEAVEALRHRRRR